MQNQNVSLILFRLLPQMDQIMIDVIVTYTANGLYLFAGTQ